MRRLLKWAGILLGCLVALVAVLAVVAYFLSESKLDTRYTAAALLPAAEAAPDSTLLARGAHLARTSGCQGCHGDDLGGQVMIDAPPFLVTASNLTAGEGGVGAQYDVSTWEQAIRQGIAHDGRGLWVMPSEVYYHFTDDDVRALAAFLERVPAVDNALPATTIRPMGRMLVAAGAVKPAPDLVDASATRLAAAVPGPTAEYGAYLASITCQGCHGKDLHGAPHPEPGGPFAPDLASVGQWSQAEFVQAMRTGMRPSGIALDPRWMPWDKDFRYMTDDELAALYAYLQNLPPEAGH